MFGIDDYTFLHGKVAAGLFAQFHELVSCAPLYASSLKLEDSIAVTILPRDRLLLGRGPDSMIAILQS
jgi:hypothetical protein